jgi:hypothetical protein
MLTFAAGGEDIASSNACTNVAYSDVRPESWYYDAVYFCQKNGIVTGNGTNQFLPEQPVTAEESYAILTRLHQNYHGISPVVSAEDPSWSAPYRAYCIAHQIMSEEEAESYSFLTRELFVLFLSRIFDFTSWDTINEITNILDYDTTSPLGKLVLRYYQAGVLSGTNEYGLFSPYARLSRGECVTILSRIICPENRIAFSVKGDVFQMELMFLGHEQSATVYDFDGKYIYLTEDFGEQGTVWYVTDLYGKTLLQSKHEIRRSSDGVFPIDNDTGQTSFWNTDGTLILSATSHLDYGFQYGFLPVQDGDSVQLIDTQGVRRLSLKTDSYWVTNAAFGTYIPVAPYENGVDGYTYLLDTQTGQIVELPYAFVPSFSLGGEAYGLMVIRTYDKEIQSWRYNVVDTSLNKLFASDQDSAQICSGGYVLAQEGSTYYIRDSSGIVTSLPMSEYGKVEALSPSGRIVQLFNTEAQQTSDWTIQISDYRTGEIFASFSYDTYVLQNRTITHPYSIGGGETAIDIIDEHNNVMVSSVPASDIWYGKEGQLLYRYDGSYYYLSS